MNIYCVFEERLNPIEDFFIYLIFLSNHHVLKIKLYTKDFNEDHLLNIMNKDNGVAYIGSWTIKHTLIENKKKLYFFNHSIDMSFTVDYEDIKECLNKIYNKIKI